VESTGMCFLAAAAGSLGALKDAGSNGSESAAGSQAAGHRSKRYMK
jgi:hypothetical protein